MKKKKKNLYLKIVIRNTCLNFDRILVYWIRGNRSGWSNKWTGKQTGGQCKNYIPPPLVVDNVEGGYLDFSHLTELKNI